MPPQSTLTESTWCSSGEACARLGVRPQTLYAYVSRGYLTPRKEGTRSRFSVAELDQLAAKGRRRRRTGRLEVLIDTEVTLLEPEGRLCYRGVDIADIVGRWSFERTAELLWSGGDDGEPEPWPEPAAPSLPRGAPSHLGDRVRVAAAVLASTAEVPDRDLGVASTVGRRLIPTLVAALPVVGTAPATGAPIAARLWPRLSSARATRARVEALDAALVVLADHELAASTVAARVAASVWSPPLDVVVAAMATHAGLLASGGSGQLLEDALRAGTAPSVGFGHAIYADRDPRADLLLPIVEPFAPARLRRLLDDDRAPNVDLVMALFVLGTGMRPGAAEAIFAVARTAGWLAHAAEEYRNPFRYRPRASYVGPAPLPR
jgi:citrate synthase